MKTAKKRAGKGAARGRILVVDDYEDAREMCCEILQFAGYEALAARDGLEALKIASEQLPELILMDLSIPGIDGWEATRRIKADPRTRGIRIIALTGHALGGHEEGALSAGCDAFLTKPCLPDDLLATIARVLEPAKKKSEKSERRRREGP